MKAAFIGCGNIGGAVARGLYRKNIVSAAEMTCCDLVPECLEPFKAMDSAINTTDDSRIAAKDADLIVVSVKPWNVERTLRGFKDFLDCSRQDLVVIAAGVTFEMLSEYLEDEKATLFRVIPNTAIEVGSSMTFVSAQNASRERTDRIVEIFDSLGRAMLIPEMQMGAATALASSGIAYAMRYVRASMEGGVELGFAPKVAMQIVLSTVKGAMDLLLANGEHPETEIDRVCTPKGITIRGLNEMEKEGFSYSVIAGLRASKTW